MFVLHVGYIDRPMKRLRTFFESDAGALGQQPLELDRCSHANLLEALRDPNHEEHDSLVTWSDHFEPERFELPKSGLDLRGKMANLKALADGDDPFEVYDVEVDDSPLLGLPKPLVQAVLALDPMQRASLGALIAGSLATELVEVRHAAGQLVTAMQERDQKQSARTHRKRPRS